MTIGEGLLGYVLGEFERADVSLHSSDPGTHGAFELTGNRYSRQPAPSYERSGDGIRNTGEVFFTGLPRSAIRYVGFWCEGRFLASQAVTERQAQAGDGFRIAAGAISVYQMMID